MRARLESIAGALERLAPMTQGPGLSELPVSAPATVEQAAELLRFAAADGLRVLPVGNGSKLGWCATPPRADFLISTRRLNAIVAHEPDDGTLTAQAGILMSDLREAARIGGHFLTPDAAHPTASTLGGVLAANQSGLDRLRFGPARDHVLGMTVLLGDGTSARTGGRLVKNVTGFDLHKLYCGSRGSLCLIVEASLRLFPEPEHELLVTTHAGDAAEVARLAGAALALPARTVSVVAERTAAGWRLSARLFGKPEAVEPERALFTGVWPAATVEEGPAARTAAEQLRDSQDPAAGPVLRVTCIATETWDVLAAADELFARPHVRVQAGVAVLEFALPPEASAARLGEDCARLRSALATLAPARSGAPGLQLLNAGVDVSAPPAPAELALMRRLQDSLDPGAVFARGHLPGGL